MSHLLRSIVAFGACSLLPGLPALAADAGIEQFAPKNSFLIVQVRDFDATLAKVKKTELWSLWNSEQVQNLVKETLEDFNEQMTQSFEEMGVSRDTLLPPEGDIGMAMFAQMDEDLGIAVPHMLLSADYGANADETAKLIDAAIARAVKEDGLQYEEKDIRGRKVLIFDMPDAPDAADDGDDEMDGEMDAMMGMPGEQMEEMFDEMTLHYVRDGSRFMLASNIVALEDALEVVDGQAMESVADREDYRGSLKQIGAQDVTITALFGPMGEISGSMMPEATLTDPIFKQLFGTVEGATLGMSFDGPIGMCEQTVGVYAPGEKVGLLALLDTETPRGTVPSFVGSDTIGFMRMNFEFSGLMDLVRKVVAGLPEEMRGEVDMQMQQLGPMFEQAFAGMGPEMDMATTLKRPVTAESQSVTMGIKCDKPEGVNTVLTTFGPQMGMAPRDFLGKTIYSSDFAPFSIGLGGGWLVFGENDSVEQAMRSGENAEGATLAGDALFKHAVASLPDEPMVGWGFGNTVASFEYQHALAKANAAMMKQWAEEMKAEGMEVDEEMLDASDDMLVQVFELLTPEMLSEFIGPSSYRLDSVADGFVFRYYQLGPVEKASH